VAHWVLRYGNRLTLAPKPEVAALARDILKYLAEHPGAEDTVEGIARWWLLHQNILRAITLVEAALEKLVKQKAITEYVGPDGRTYYRISSKT